MAKILVVDDGPDFVEATRSRPMNTFTWTPSWSSPSLQTGW